MSAELERLRACARALRELHEACADVYRTGRIPALPYVSAGYQLAALDEAASDLPTPDELATWRAGRLIFAIRDYRDRIEGARGVRPSLRETKELFERHGGRGSPA